MRFLALVACCVVLASCGNGPGGGGVSTPLQNPDGTSPAASAGAWSVTRLDPSGNPIIAYHDAALDKVKVMHCNDLHCEGADEDIAVVDSQAGHDGLSGLAMTLDASGHPVVAYNVAPVDIPLVEAEASLRIAHCVDPGCADGVSITDPIPQAARVGAVSHPYTIELDGAGNPVVLATTGILRCNDPNCAGGDETYTSFADEMYDDDHSRFWSQMVIGGDGNPLLLGANVAQQPPTDSLLAVCHDPVCVDKTVETVLPGGDFSTQMVLDGGGNPVLVAVTAADGLTVVRCNDPRCSGGDESVTSNLAPDRDRRSGPTLAIDGDGNPALAFYSLSFPSYDAGDPVKVAPGGITILRCNDPACAGDGEHLSVVLNPLNPDHTISYRPTDGSPLLSEYGDGLPSLGVDARGNPFVSFDLLRPEQVDEKAKLRDFEHPTPPSTHSLWVLRCDDPRCESAT